MGLVSGLLLFPVTGPIRAFRLLLEHLHAEAESALRDEGRAFAELIDLSMRHNAGQISDEAFAEQETELLARLESIREYRNELQSAEFDPTADDPMEDEPMENEPETVESGTDEPALTAADVDEEEG